MPKYTKKQLAKLHAGLRTMIDRVEAEDSRIDKIKDKDKTYVLTKDDRVLLKKHGYDPRSFPNWNSEIVVKLRYFIESR